MNTTPALTYLRSHAPHVRPRIAVLLGLGWHELTEHLFDPVRIAYADLPGFPDGGATVPGDGGRAADELWLGQLGSIEVAVLAARALTHDSGRCDGMKLPLRVLHELGCSVLVQTDAVASLAREFVPGSLMLVRDHINLPQRSPLVGEPGAGRFVGMGDAYDARLREDTAQVAQGLGVAVHEGTYVWATGPQLETPAEARAWRQWGGDGVGTATVPETIAARHAGMRVLSLALVTRWATGLSPEPSGQLQARQQAHACSAMAADVLVQAIKYLRIDATASWPGSL